jgi:hypothetical protein
MHLCLFFSATMQRLLYRFDYWEVNDFAEKNFDTSKIKHSFVKRFCGCPHGRAGESAARCDCMVLNI